MFERQDCRKLHDFLAHKYSGFFDNFQERSINILVYVVII